MSALQREAARQRAVKKGAEARRAGHPASANPYKPLGGRRHLGGSRHGEWSLYPAWACGWASAGEKDKTS